MKKRRVYRPRIVGNQVMTPADLKRLHKELLEFERIDLGTLSQFAVAEKAMHKRSGIKSVACRQGAFAR
jgi:hypothetical protein